MDFISKKGTQVVAPLMLFVIAFRSLFKDNATIRTVCIGVAYMFSLYLFAYLYKTKDWNRLMPLLFMVLVVVLLFIYTKVT
jgi:hypothetical protein